MSIFRFYLKVRKDRDEGMYQCMAYNDLDTRYSSGQLRVLGDRENKEKWRPSFAKHPLEEKMFAAEGGNISIKYDYQSLALLNTPTFTCHNWFWLLRSDSCYKNCKHYPSNSKILIQKLIQPESALFFSDQKFLLPFIHYKNSPNNSYDNAYDRSNETTKVNDSNYFHSPTNFLVMTVQGILNKLPFFISGAENGWEFYNFFFPKTPLHCMFAFDTSFTSMLFQPLLINFIFSKSALKLFAKVFLKNCFPKQVYKKYFKLLFKMLFRNLPKACVKLVVKYSFKAILNILAKMYFFFFLIYLFSYGRRKKLGKTN